MLRIEKTEDDGRRALALAGQIIGPWVDELRHLCDPAAGPQALLLDLADVSFADRDGVALLCALRDRGAILLHCSAFLLEQLRTSECCR